VPRQVSLKPLINIRLKTLLYVLLLISVTTFAAYAAMVRIMRDRVSDEVLRRAESLSRSIAAASGYSLFSDDLLGLDTLVHKVQDSNPDLNQLAILDPGNKAIVHSDLDRIGEVYRLSEGRILKTLTDGLVVREVSGENGATFEIANQIHFMDRNLGSVILSLNKSVVTSAQRSAQKRIAWVFAAILVIGAASSVFVSSFLTRPIQELSSGIAELKEGNVTHRLRIYSQDELGELTISFNEMTDIITSQKQELEKYATEIEESYISTVKVLAAAIDARDHYTSGHSTRVARLSLALGEAFGLQEDELDDLEVACLFHDVGKIKIPDSILLKEGRLDESEMREMRRHPEYGAEILSKANSLLRYIPTVRHHHEWFDGTGYPDGLKSDKIPLSAAIVSLADAFDAMTSDRPYRKALTPEESSKEMHNVSGRQFSPKHIEIFDMIIKKRKREFFPQSRGSSL
jgi:putative nucleotidyltransferase with HDIG domain